VKEITSPHAVSARQDGGEESGIPRWRRDNRAAADRCGLLGSPTQVVKIMTPPGRCGGEKVEGETEVVIEKLFGVLKTIGGDLVPISVNGTSAMVRNLCQGLPDYGD